MLIAHTNPAKRDVTRPVLTSAADVERYLDKGEFPAESEFLPVPADVAVTRGCFWVQPERSPYPGICSFFINPALSGSFSLNPTPNAAPWVCYSLGGKLIMGKVERDATGSKLKPIINGLHRPIDLTKARYIGRAEAAL